MLNSTKARWIAMIWALATTMSCDDECVTTMDCGSGKKCIEGACVATDALPSDDGESVDSETNNDAPPLQKEEDTGDTDTETEQAATPTACTGENLYFGAASNLCWYKGFLSQGGVLFSEAPGLCAGIYTNEKPWRLPMIEELFTIFRGCENDNGCDLQDPDCLDQSCFEDCSNDTCPRDEGPSNGCYVVSPLVPQSSCGVYWSSSLKEGATEGIYSWVISSTTGAIQDLDVYFSWGAFVTCVFEVSE